MKQNDPFLAGFSWHLYGRARRGAQAAMQQFRQVALRHCPGGYGLPFDDVLPAEWLCEPDKTKRNRHFGGVTVLWAWVGQILEHHASCSRGLSLIQSWCKGAGLDAPKGDTSSYYQGRMRLIEEFLDRITSALRGGIREEDRWNGLALKAFDGTSVKLLDTEANQELYPQPSSQAEGCGFPVMGIVGLLNMSHGAWEGFTTGSGNMHDARAAQDDVRPARQEPRAVKRRPKPYHLLTAPRRVFRETFPQGELRLNHVPFGSCHSGHHAIRVSP